MYGTILIYATQYDTTINLKNNNKIKKNNNKINNNQVRLYKRAFHFHKLKIKQKM